MQLRPRNDYLTIELEDVSTQTLGRLIVVNRTTPAMRAGRVVAVGPNVNELSPGDRVMMPSECCHAVVPGRDKLETVVVKESQVDVAVPDGVEIERSHHL